MSLLTWYSLLTYIGHENVICHDIVDAIIHFRSLSDVMDHPMLKLNFSILTTGISDSERLGEREMQKRLHKDIGKK